MYHNQHCSIFCSVSCGGAGSRVGVSVQSLHAALEGSALQSHAPLGCITIMGLFQNQRSPADLQQIFCLSLHLSLWFGSHGSSVTYKFQLVSGETLGYPTYSRDVGFEPVTAPLDKVHHRFCKCLSQGTRLGTGTLIWVNEGTSAPAAPESLLM